MLALISQGRAVDTVPIVVGDADTQTLRQVVNAAEIADDATKREIEKLAAQAIHLVDSSTENARKAQDGATRAETAVRLSSLSLMPRMPPVGLVLPLRQLIGLRYGCPRRRTV